MYKINIMSGAAAISRAKARRGMTANEPHMSNQAANHFGKVLEKDISPDQLLIQHDYKLYVFEQKIRELFEMFTKNPNTNGLETVNETMLTEALQSLDLRIENIEKSPESSNSSHRLDNIEKDQKELKSLLLKVQNMAMETSVKVMKMQDNIKNNGANTVLEEPLDLSLSDNNLEENKDSKKGKKR